MNPVKTSLLALLVIPFASCDAVQPRPACKVQPAEYAAKYDLESMTGTCTDKIVTAEIVHLNFYRAPVKSADQRSSVALEPAVVAHAIDDATEKAKEADPKAVFPEMKEFSQAKYLSTEPPADNICRAPEFDEPTSITTPDVPLLKYDWSNFGMVVTPSINAIHWGADLTRTDGDCVAKYKVTAVYPTVHCGDGEKDVLGDDGKPTGKKEPDPESGGPDDMKCKYSASEGNGISPLIPQHCDDKSLICVADGEFPVSTKL